MFENWDEQVRRALFFSRHEATLVGSPVIQPEHILLGLDRENEEAVEKLLNTLGTSMHALRAKVESHPSFSKKPPIAPNTEIPLSSKSKEVLGVTASEAKIMQDSVVSCKHLLIGLSKVEDTLAHQILIDSGLREDDLKFLLRRLEEIETTKQQSSGSQDAEREIVLIWDPEVVNASDYALLVRALGDLVRSGGGLGVHRSSTAGVTLQCDQGVLV